LRAYLIGDFSKTRHKIIGYTLADNILDGWDRDSHQMKKNEYGVFEITLPAQNGKPAIPHDSKIKVGEQTPSQSCVN
jgi:1,4-alpha-glucan branching enzyme